MSSVRLVSIEIVHRDYGVCRLVCDWNKGNTFSTAIQFNMGRGMSRSEQVRSHATLAAALGRLARLAKRVA